MLLTILIFAAFGAAYGYMRGYDPTLWAIYGAVAALILLWSQYLNAPDTKTSMGGFIPALVVLWVLPSYSPRQCAE